MSPIYRSKYSASSSFDHLVAQVSGVWGDRSAAAEKLVPPGYLSHQAANRLCCEQDFARTPRDLQAHCQCTNSEVDLRKERSELEAAGFFAALLQKQMQLGTEGETRNPLGDTDNSAWRWLARNAQINPVGSLLWELLSRPLSTLLPAKICLSLAAPQTSPALLDHLPFCLPIGR